MNLEITHIYHSSFRIENEKVVLFIDVFNNFDQLFIPKEKKVYFLATHSHGDHYSDEILNYSKEYNVNYILSDDIIVKAENNITIVKKGDKLKLKEFDLEVFGTTDLGVSFFISLGDINIFHSGDLNWWHWEESELETQLVEEKDYKREIGELVGKQIDIGIVPVDPRLGTGTFLGINYFVELLSPKIIIPMHFSDNFSVTSLIPNYENTKVIRIKSKFHKVDCQFT